MSDRASDDVPRWFCWTRFGTEAGQPLRAIVERKERERLANAGLFLWGIGNSVAPGMKELVRLCDEPEVLFSPIKGAPRSVDVQPEKVLAWTRGEALDGQPYQLPPHSLVVSGESGPVGRRSHYALVCHSRDPLVFEGSAAALTFQSLRNLTSGSPVGWSQVTAVVAHTFDEDKADGQTYPVAFRATLVYPYFLRLRDPISLAGAADHLNSRLLQSAVPTVL